MYIIFLQEVRLNRVYHIYLKYKTKYLDLTIQLGGSHPSLIELKIKDSKTQHTKEAATKSMEAAKQSRKAATKSREAAIRSREAEKRIHASAIQKHIIPIILEVKNRLFNLEKQIVEEKTRLEEVQKRLSYTDEALEEGSKLDPPNLPILELYRVRNVVSVLENLIRVEENVLMVLDLLANNELNQLNYFNQSVMENVAHVMKENDTAEKLENGNLLVDKYLIMNNSYSYSIIIDPTDIFYKTNNFIFDLEKKMSSKKNVFVVFRQFIHTDPTGKKYREVKNYIKICYDKLDELKTTKSLNYFRRLIENLKDCLSITTESFINQLYYNDIIQEDIKLISNHKRKYPKITRYILALLGMN